jgi:hypothetical protein
VKNQIGFDRLIGHSRQPAAAAKSRPAGLVISPRKAAASLP